MRQRQYPEQYNCTHYFGHCNKAKIIIETVHCSTGSTLSVLQYIVQAQCSAAGLAIAHRPYYTQCWESSWLTFHRCTEWAQSQVWGGYTTLHLCSGEDYNWSLTDNNDLGLVDHDHLHQTVDNTAVGICHPWVYCNTMLYNYNICIKYTVSFWRFRWIFL